MAPEPQEAPAPRAARPEPGLALVVRAPGDVALERRVLVIGGGTVVLLAVALVRLWSPARVVLLGRHGHHGGPARRDRRPARPAAAWRHRPAVGG
jgi:hypothetical protein